LKSNDKDMLIQKISDLVKSGKLKFKGDFGLLQAKGNKVLIYLCVAVNAPPELRVCEETGKVVYKESGYHLNDLLALIGRSMRAETAEGNSQKALALIEKEF